MKLSRFLIVLMVIVQFGFVPFGVQSQTKTYTETRKLLLKMERREGNQALRKIFEEGKKRMPDLIEALNDSEEKVNLNAQVVLKYLAVPEGLNALDEWYKKQQGNYSMPNMTMSSDVEHLNGNQHDLAELVLKNARLFEAGRYGRKELCAKLIGYNKDFKTVLIEIINGCVDGNV